MEIHSNSPKLYYGFKSYSNAEMKLGLNLAKLSESKTFTYDVTITCAHVCAMSWSDARITALTLASWLCEPDIVIDIEHGKTVYCKEAERDLVNDGERL